MIEPNEEVMREMNKYLEGTTIEEILVKNRKIFHFQVMFTKEQLKQDIDVLDLRPRADHCLRRSGFNTLEQIVNGVYTKESETSKRQLLRIRNLGKNTADEILMQLFYYQFTVLPESKKKAYMELIALTNVA